MSEAMTAIDIPVNAKVECIDGIGGHSSCIILNPTTDEVTHVVVEEDTFPARKRLVRINQIVESTPTSIRLDCTRSELGHMELFSETEYIHSTISHYTVEAGLLMQPYVVPENKYIALEHEHIPPHELAVRRGAKVEAVNGRVGKVDEFLVDPINGQITHLILHEGHLWGQKDVSIPVSAIDRIEEDVVHLKIDKQRIEELPVISVRRFGW